MSSFYTYMHIRKSDYQVFYVGKGCGGRANSAYGRSAYWTRVANKHGLDVKILAHWPTEEEAFLHEKLLISCFKDMHSPLVNMTLGGDGSSGITPSVETRAKMRLAHLGTKMPPRSAEHRAKLAKAQTGRSPGNKGVSPSDETRMRQSQARVGRKLSKTTRQKMSDAHKGKVKSTETRQKMSAAKQGCAMSPETKAKLSMLAKARFQAKSQLVTNKNPREIINLDDRVAHINTALDVLSA